MENQNLITGYKIRSKSLDTDYGESIYFLEESGVKFTSNNNIQLNDDSEISYLYEDRTNELKQFYYEANQYLAQ